MKTSNDIRKIYLMLFKSNIKTSSNRELKKQKREKEFELKIINTEFNKREVFLFKEK